MGVSGSTDCLVWCLQEVCAEHYIHVMAFELVRDLASMVQVVEGTHACLNRRAAEKVESCGKSANRLDSLIPYYTNPPLPACDCREGRGGRASKLAPGCIVHHSNAPPTLWYTPTAEVKGHRHHTNKDLTSNKLVGPHPLHAKCKLITLILTPSFYLGGVCD